MAAIHQLVAGFSNGDAISNEALTLRRIFRSWGHASDIFSERRRILPELRREARDIAECPSAFGVADIALLHLSIGSPVNDVFASLPSAKAILYHNVTPPHYFSTIQPRIAFDLAKGLDQVRSLAGVAKINMADSRFNADELTALGYQNVTTLPLVLDTERLNAAPDRALMKRLDDGKINVLFVGRCAPNKRIEDALVAFSYFQRFVEPESRFIHVGSFAGTERYYYYLLSVARDLRIRNAIFAQSVPQPQLNAYYRGAHVFLSMSEHEGFCIPLIESMFHNLPIVAWAAAAVPETLDGAGCLVREKSFEAIAELMGQLVRNKALRNAVIEGQRQRVDRYFKRDLESELRGRLAEILQ
jgi:L-malate glycosyltransferase